MCVLTSPIHCASSPDYRWEIGQNCIPPKTHGNQMGTALPSYVYVRRTWQYRHRTGEDIKHVPCAVCAVFRMCNAHWTAHMARHGHKTPENRKFSTQVSWRGHTYPLAFMSFQSFAIFVGSLLSKLQILVKMQHKSRQKNEMLKTLEMLFNVTLLIATIKNDSELEKVWQITIVLHLQGVWLLGGW